MVCLYHNTNLAYITRRVNTMMYELLKTLYERACRR